MGKNEFIDKIIDKLEEKFQWEKFDDLRPHLLCFI